VTRSDFEQDLPDERSQSGYVIAALLAAALLIVALVTYSHDNARPQIATAQDCAAIGDSSSRLGCYDEIFHRPGPEPAKGATAPIENR
jgi:hypothetical protein